ncbi:hypothetical protein, partial [Aquimarina algiphila]|uniref:hypothetical protein n=1 Tax=Aquimarina algiphila TaxID=2047982 RepID=UPI00232E4ABE
TRFWELFCYALFKQEYPGQFHRNLQPALFSKNDFILDITKTKYRNTSEAFIQILVINVIMMNCFRLKLVLLTSINI